MNDYSLLNLILPRYLRSVNSRQQQLIIRHSSPDTDIDGVNPPSTPIDSSADNELLLLLGGEEVHLRRVKWSPVDFYALPGYISVSSLSDCSDGYVLSRGRALYPMDISSALAVYALGIEASHTGESLKVVDLCCSPGNKFLMISELLSSDSLIVGVDISESRLNVCKSLLRRYNRHFSGSSSSSSNSAMGPRQLVFHGDSTRFSSDNNCAGSLVYDSTVYRREYSHLADRIKLNKSTRSKIRKSLKAVEGRLLQGKEPSSVGADSSCTESDFILLDNFDYAIVDAECTHDASYRHLSHINIVPHNDHGDELVEEEEDYRLPLSSDGCSVKPDVRLSISDSSSNSKSHRTMNESNNLRALQRDLVHNGFRLLRPGGVLVYSTCSKDELQNEEVIKWLLLTEGRRVQVVPIIDDIRQYISKAIACSSIISDEHTVVETSNISPDEVGMELLQQELSELISSLKTLGTSGIRDLSDNICRDVASQDSPILMESTALRGTMHISYKSGMSGLFIAKIRKAVDD